MIASSSEKKLTIYIILYEDVYETKFGDGYYGYFEAAFFLLGNAEAFLEQKRAGAGEFAGYHLKITEISIDKGELVFHSDFSPFDRISKDEVINYLKT